MVLRNTKKSKDNIVTVPKDFEWSSQSATDAMTYIFQKSDMKWKAAQSNTTPTSPQRTVIKWLKMKYEKQYV